MPRAVPDKPSLAAVLETGVCIAWAGGVWQPWTAERRLPPTCKVYLDLDPREV